MMRCRIFVLACVLLCGLVPRYAEALIVVGVNTVNPNKLNDQQQDQLIEQLRANGVKTIRLPLVDDKSIRFIVDAYQHGIATVLIIYPTSGSTNARMRPADPSIGLGWRVAAFSDIDPQAFRGWAAIQLSTLEAAGVHLAAFEFGNEINSAAYDGDFLSRSSGRILGISDLDNVADPQIAAITTGYRVYLKTLAVFRQLRDGSKLNRSTPILSAGLADPGPPSPPKSWNKRDSISIAATLEFLRRNGLDRLVDGYGVHVYPNGDPGITLAARIDTLGHDTFAMCTSAKPCWLTEWAFNNANQSCPLNDETRLHLFQTERNAFKQFAGQGRLAATIYFSWSGSPGDKENQGAIFRCNALTDAGKLVLSPL